MDEALWSSIGRASLGGLIRDHNGDWIRGFMANLGVYSVMFAELQGIYHGLCLAWSKGIKKVVLEAYNLSIKMVLNRAKDGCIQNIALVKEIRKMITREWQIQVTHINQEGNKCANLLANM
ncbi:conserved hypothetical protein, partial [Ricinus communis]